MFSLSDSSLTSTKTSKTTTAKKDGVNLEILKEQDNSMINTYSLLAVNDKAPFVNADGASVSNLTSVNNETVILYAQWEQNPVKTVNDLLREQHQ